MPRIIVSVTNDLVTDQRVRKVCATLESEDFEILLIGRKLPQSLPIQRSYKTYRMRLLFKKSFLFYAEYNVRLFLKLLFVRKDILLANDLDTLLPNFLISSLFGKKIVYDSHELFTEVPELVHRPSVQNVWLRIEKFIFPKLKNVITVCDSIAKYYNDKYKVSVLVIRNLPSQNNQIVKSKLPFDTNGKKIVLYQGALNVGRGLELLIDSMLLLNDWLLVIVGEGDIMDSLKEKVVINKVSSKVKFMGRLLPEDLNKITPIATVGVSLEEDLSLSYHFALPNKLFDYIQAKVPVLVSNLPEMSSVVKAYKVGEVLKERTPENLAKQLIEIAKVNNSEWNFDDTIAVLNWENESKKLKEIYQNLK